MATTTVASIQVPPKSNALPFQSNNSFGSGDRNMIEIEHADLLRSAFDLVRWRKYEGNSLLSFPLTYRAAKQGESLALRLHWGKETPAPLSSTFAFAPPATIAILTITLLLLSATSTTASSTSAFAPPVTVATLAIALLLLSIASTVTILHLRFHSSCSCRCNRLLGLNSL